ncbi:hypothetical protein V501_08222 [Pseudogymnoascus sp. VKM F-4519 (FW-2642)]|nr:hypothetical protein V501_08222 [Pseudogymnoascus sp. VKM F-4519 (FW-2642)]
MPCYQNPILPGFFPDPSIIRVDDTYYLINSSFQFFPGLPIHTSRDLINWELIGHAINRTSQLSLRNATTKVNSVERKEVFTGGLYAPTIRFHNGVFYIVCTNLSGSTVMRSNEDFQPQNFIITCKNLSDPDSFSDPILFDFYGIDPSLLFDDDGNVYMHGSFIHGYNKRPATVIRQAAIDLKTGRLISETRDIWEGSGGHVPEGPHIYKRDGFYWLLIAEGGTHRRHKVTMSRSKNVWGPYESYEHNPLTTGREGGIVTCVGHADLVEDTSGKWWAVMLARRDFGLCYPLGRETFMVSVDWPKGEFPRFEMAELNQRLSSRRVASKRRGFSTEYQVTISSPHSLYLRDPNLQDYKQGDNKKSIILHLREDELGTAGGNPTFIGQRQTSLDSIALAEIDLTSAPIKGHCGLTVYKDSFRHVSLDIDLDKRQISLAVHHLGQNFSFFKDTLLQASSAVRVMIQSTKEAYRFSYRTVDASKWSAETELGQVSCSDMSGDDFTGTIYGIYAYGAGGDVKFNSFNLYQKL